MTNVERVLRVLIHDVRTPIGVAQGYVRLLQEQRLETAEERERALVRTMTALGRLSRLCDEASELVGQAAPAIPAAIAATALAESVASRLREFHFVVDRMAIDPHARVGVAGGVDRLADAICVVLTTIVQATRETAPSVQMETPAAELRFVWAPRGHETIERLREPFDPWSLGGLSVAVACQTIDRSTGRVWSAKPAVIVAFPLGASRT